MPWGVSVARMPRITPFRTTSRALSISFTRALISIGLRSGNNTPEKAISIAAVSCRNPSPTRCTDSTLPSTGVFAGKTGAPSHSGDSSSTPVTGIPGLAVKDETGAFNRTQNELPVVSWSQPAAAIEEKQSALRTRSPARSPLRRTRPVAALCARRDQHESSS